MHIRQLARLSICICTIVWLAGEAAAQTLTPEERQRIMVHQDVKAAGNSGDKSFIPYLHDVVQQRKLYHYDWDDAQMALAKLGDRSQQQNIVCVFYKGDRSEGYVAGHQLAYIGGWFAIQMYLEMLNNKKVMSHWFRIGEPNDDRVWTAPDTRAMQNLPNLIPALQPITEQTPAKQTVEQWNVYIKEHMEELSKLTPTGEGVDFSGKSCPSKGREVSIRVQ